MFQKTILLYFLTFFVSNLESNTPNFNIQNMTELVTTSNAQIICKRFFTPESANKTPIICLHGGPGFSHHCMLDLQALATDRPVIFYDQSGCADSKMIDPSFNNWTFDHYMHELEEIINTLGYQKIILLGYSWGGTLAAEYAARHGEKLDALILASPLISTAQWISDCKKLAATISPEFLQTIEKHEAAGSITDPEYEQSVTIFYQNYLCRLNPWPQNVLDSCTFMNKDIYVMMWGPSEFTATGNLQNIDLTYQLSKITVPTLFTCGRYDTATPETLQNYAALMPNATVAVLENSGHMNIAEEPETYVKIIQKFLAE